MKKNLCSVIMNKKTIKNVFGRTKKPAIDKTMMYYLTATLTLFLFLTLNISNIYSAETDGEITVGLNESIEITNNGSVEETITVSNLSEGKYNLMIYNADGSTSFYRALQYAQFKLKPGSKGIFTVKELKANSLRLKVGYPSGSVKIQKSQVEAFDEQLLLEGKNYTVINTSNYNYRVDFSAWTDGAFDYTVYSDDGAIECGIDKLLDPILLNKNERIVITIRELAFNNKKGGLSFYLPSQMYTIEESGYPATINKLIKVNESDSYTNNSNSSQKVYAKAYMYGKYNYEISKDAKIISEKKDINSISITVQAGETVKITPISVTDINRTGGLQFYAPYEFFDKDYAASLLNHEPVEEVIDDIEEDVTEEVVNDDVALNETVTTVYEPSSWAAEGVASAREHQLLTEAVQNNYQSLISREEFCEVMIKLYEALGDKVAITTQNPFKDTQNSAVLKAYQLGIVTGITSSEFYPKMLINRQQMSTMLYRTIKALEPDLNNTRKKVTFSDLKSISDWAMESIEYFSYNQLINGMGNNQYSPLAEATKEQAIILVDRIYNAYDKLKDASIASSDVIDIDYKGTNVKVIQTQLLKWIADEQITIDDINLNAASFADGIYGSRTKAVIVLFQYAQQIETDGLTGPITLGCLNNVSEWKHASNKEYRYTGSVIEPIIAAATTENIDNIDNIVVTAKQSDLIASIRNKILRIQDEFGYPCTNITYLVNKAESSGDNQELLLTNVNLALYNLSSINDDIYKDCINYGGLIENTMITAFTSQLLKKGTDDSFYQKMGTNISVNSMKLYAKVAKDPYLMNLFKEMLLKIGISMSADELINEMQSKQNVLGSALYDSLAKKALHSGLYDIESDIYNIYLSPSPTLVLQNKRILPDMIRLVETYQTFSLEHRLNQDFIATLDSMYSSQSTWCGYISYGSIGATVLSGGTLAFVTIPLAKISSSASDTTEYLSWLAKVSQNVYAGKTILYKLDYLDQVETIAFPVIKK